jgi:hypothetical protein
VFGRRPDAKSIPDLPALRAFMPFVSPRRNESLVYFEQELEAEPALRFAEERNRARDPARPITFFHLVLCALARVLTERPRLNRFVCGGRLWQRDGVWITFSAKQRLEDGAPLLTVKRRIDPGAGLEALVDGILAGLGEGRSGRPSSSDREVGLLLRLPSPVVRIALGLVHGADALGLLPRSLIEGDPLYCSAFVANLGSVGLEAGYHHLWEHGNCPIFCTIGRLRSSPDGRRVTLKWTYDERVEDGLYCARSLERLRELLERPEQLAAVTP